MSEVLRIEGLRFSWPGGGWTLALDSLVLARGERLFLHGPSGSGKSTLLNLVAGTLKPQAGRVCIAGEDMAARSGPARDRLRADHLGIVFQQFNLLPFLSLVENVTLPCRFSARRRRRAEKRQGRVTFSTRLRKGSKLNCWNTMPRWSARRRSRAGPERAAMSSPAMQTRPACGLSVPATRLSRVLLPLPLGPCRNRRSPRASTSESRARVQPPPGHEKRSPSMRSTSLMGED